MILYKSNCARCALGVARKAALKPPPPKRCRDRQDSFARAKRLDGGAFTAAFAECAASSPHPVNPQAEILGCSMLELGGWRFSSFTASTFSQFVRACGLWFRELS